MRVAALYDVHGNDAARAAVLADPRCAVADLSLRSATPAPRYALDHASQLLEPPTLDDVTAFFEGLRGA